MDKKDPEAFGEIKNYGREPSLEADATSRGVRRLTAHELAELRRDMAESSAWMRAELARRRKRT